MKKPLRIGVPVRGLLPGGVRRFILQLVQNLATLATDVELYAFYDDVNLERELLGCRTVHVRSSNRVLWDYLLFPIAARAHALDCVIYPNHVIPVTHLALLNTRRINVIHDLAYFSKTLHEYKLADTLYMRALMGLSCRVADHTVTVSAATRDDVVNILKADRKKISVIHLGLEPAFKQPQNNAAAHEVLERLGVKQPYFFYCGTLSPRKNILRALKALKAIADRVPHRFYLSSGQSWHDRDVREYWARELPARVVHLGYLSEEELRVMYANAELYIYPSLYEGFGLPIIEAQASGCPVLTSTLKSCPEVGGPGAHYVDAQSVESIAEGMLKIVQDPTYRQQLIRQGCSNVERFSWQSCAMEYLQLIRQLTAGRASI